MSLEKVEIGNINISRMIIGGNAFSGFSHLGPENDLRVKRYYTVSRIKETLKKAEELGINTFIGRADNHIMRMLMEYWDEGGTIQWIAQTCPEIENLQNCIQKAVSSGCKACYIHGGQMDYYLANNCLEGVAPAIETIKKAGIPAGIAGHNPEVFKWAEKNLELDFYMCCYYNSMNRDEKAEHVSGKPEWFREEDREIMVNLISSLGKPAIHYKVLAAGRIEPEKAFAFVARHLREEDAVCLGFYTEDYPSMIQEDVELFKMSLADLK
ncbi:MAG: hypothetical protein ABIA63_00670 [bacterium]